MVVWARSAPEKQKTVTTQTAQSQIPRFPQSHRLRIFAPWISVDHHWQNSGFFGFFLALAAGGFPAPPPQIIPRRMFKKFFFRPPEKPGKPIKNPGPGHPLQQSAELFSSPRKAPVGH